MNASTPATSGWDMMDLINTDMLDMSDSQPQKGMDSPMTDMRRDSLGPTPEMAYTNGNPWSQVQYSGVQQPVSSLPTPPMEALTRPRNGTTSSLQLGHGFTFDHYPRNEAFDQGLNQHGYAFQGQIDNNWHNEFLAAQASAGHVATPASVLSLSLPHPPSNHQTGTLSYSQPPLFNSQFAPHSQTNYTHPVYSGGSAPYFLATGSASHSHHGDSNQRFQYDPSWQNMPGSVINLQHGGMPFAEFNAPSISPNQRVDQGSAMDFDFAARMPSQMYNSRSGDHGNSFGALLGSGGGNVQQGFRGDVEASAPSFGTAPPNRASQPGIINSFRHSEQHPTDADHKHNHDMGIASSQQVASEDGNSGFNSTPVLTTSAPPRSWTSINNPNNDASNSSMSNTKNGTTSTAQAELPTRKKKAAKKANPPNSKSPEPALPAPLSVEEIRTNAAAGPALKSPTPPALQPSKKKRKRAENELPANEPAVKISAVALSPVPAAPTPPTQKMESRKRRKVTSPPIDEPIAASVESPAREAPIKESRERKKRKSKVVQQPQLTPDTSGPEGDSEDVKPVVKAKKSKKASKANGSSAIGQKTGAYSKEEFQALDAAIASIRKEHNLTPKEMCEIIQANGNELSKHAKAPPNFWADIASALPDRPRQSIQKCARRKYTNAQKHSGWNSEEDEEVREAYALYPGKWKLIGEAVGRFHEEVRYRWRDYIEPGTARVEDVWTGEEEELFEKLTGEMRDKARKEHAQNVRTGKASGEFDEAAFKPAFQPLSKMMKTRNRLQCSNKWKNMQLQLAKEKESSEDSPSSLRDNKPSARTLQAYNDFDKKMQMGDKLDCLKQTLEGVKRYKIKKEKRIPWGEIKKANMTSRWQTVDRKVVFEKFKVLASVAADTVPQEALEIIIRYIEDKYTKAALNKRYDGQKQVRSPRPKTSPRRKSTKSKATVSDSDSDDEEHGDEDEDEDTPAPPPRKKVAKAPVKKVASEKASPAKATTSDSSTATTSDSDSTKTSNTSSESS